MARTYQEDLALVQNGAKVVESATAMALQLNAKKQSVADRMAELVKDVESLYGTSEPEKLAALVEGITKENNAATDAYVEAANKFAAEISAIDIELKAIGG